MDEPEWQDYLMQRPCPICGGREGRIHWNQNGQDVVYCKPCDRSVYNASKTETGREARSLSNVRHTPPSQRWRLLERAHGCCEVCGAREALVIDHVLSVKDGFEFLTETQLNSDENRMVLCALCNSGKRSQTLPLWLFAAILKRRTEER